MSVELDPASAARYVVWGGLGLGLALGAIGQATRFCVRGAIADWIAMRSAGRLFSWMLAVALGAVLLQALLAAGLFDAARTVAWSDRFVWASYLVGGTVFGFGMILAGGCPQRCLVKAGSGNLKALVVLLVVAVTAAMTLRGAFAGVRAGTLDALGATLKSPQDLGSILAGVLPLPAAVARWAIALAALGAVLAWGWRMRASLERSHWVGGLGVALLLPAAFMLTGHLGFLAEHPETLEPAWLGTQSRRPEGLTFSAPLAHTLDLLTLWSDKATVATFGVTMALGVLLGAAVSARLRGEYRAESFGSPRELREHLAGGVLMGFGGVTAVGCSVGNGVTGVALLSVGALLATAGIVAGAVLALRYQLWRAEALPPAMAAAPAR